METYEDFELPFNNEDIFLDYISSFIPLEASSSAEAISEVGKGKPSCFNCPHCNKKPVSQVALYQHICRYHKNYERMAEKAENKRLKIEKNECTQLKHDLTSYMEYNIGGDDSIMKTNIIKIVNKCGYKKNVIVELCTQLKEECERETEYLRAKEEELLKTFNTFPVGITHGVKHPNADVNVSEIEKLRKYCNYSLEFADYAERTSPAMKKKLKDARFIQEVLLNMNTAVLRINTDANANASSSSVISADVSTPYYSPNQLE